MQMNFYLNENSPTVFEDSKLKPHTEMPPLHSTTINHHAIRVQCPFMDRLVIVTAVFDS